MLQMILGQHQNPLQFQRGIYGLREPWLMNSCKDSPFTENKTGAQTSAMHNHPEFQHFGWRKRRHDQRPRQTWIRA